MLNRNSCSDFRSEIGEPLDADHELRLHHTEHTGARAGVLDPEIDELGPLFEKTPCHSELLDALDLGQCRDRRQRDHVGE